MNPVCGNGNIVPKISDADIAYPSDNPDADRFQAYRKTYARYKNIHSDDLFGRSLFKFRLNAKWHKIQDGKSRGKATMQLSRPFYH